MTNDTENIGFLMVPGITKFLKVVLWTSASFYACAFLVLRQLHRRNGDPRKRIHIFHISADAGGGGEKCLWAIIQAYSQSCQVPTQLNLYTHADVPHILTLFQKASRDFAIEIPVFGGDRYTTNIRPHIRVSLRPLRTGRLLTKKWPVFQHMGEFLSGILMGAEAAFMATGSYKDEIWDTQGLAATTCIYTLMTSLCMRPIYAYIHWSWVNSDNITEWNQLRMSRRSLYNLLITQIYRVLGSLYALPICVNSTFTEERMKVAWRLHAPDSMVKILPPVDRDLAVYASHPKEEVILSIAQFRPEKNQVQQVRAFARLLHKYNISPSTRFCMCGSLSRPEDRNLSLMLFELAKECCGSKCSVTYKDYETGEERATSNANQNVPSMQILVNVPEKELTRLRSIAKVGLHTMKDEHFGIAVVDLLLAGAVVITHRSGGPLLDILRAPSDEEANGCEGFNVTNELGNELGFTAETDDEFADQLHKALEMGSDVKRRLKLAQAVASKRFLSSLDFGSKVLLAWHPLSRPPQAKKQL